MKKPMPGRGLALVLLSAAAYGTMPILTKQAYASGVGLFALLAFRFSVAAVLFGLLSRGGAPLPRATRLRLWGLGAIFVGNSFAYFRALETLDASRVALLLYIYPVVVTFLSAVLGLEPLRVRGLACAVLAFAGAGLAVGRARSGVEASGIVMALLAACLYAVFVVLASRLPPGVSSRAAALHVAQIGAVAYVASALVRGEGLPASLPGWLSVVAIALFCTVVAHQAFLAGLAAVGPGRAAVASAFEVVVTLSLAALFLGEGVGPRQWLGASLILGAVILQNTRSG